MSYLVAPDLFTKERRMLMSMQDKRVMVKDTVDDKNPRSARLPDKVDAQGFMEMFVNRIATLRTP